MSKPRIKRDPTTGLYCCHPTPLGEKLNKVSGFGATMESAYTNYVIRNFKAEGEKVHKRYLGDGCRGVVQETPNTSLSGERILYVGEILDSIPPITSHRALDVRHPDGGYYNNPNLLPPLKEVVREESSTLRLKPVSPPPKRVLNEDVSWTGFKKWWKGLW